MIGVRIFRRLVSQLSPYEVPEEMETTGVGEVDVEVEENSRRPSGLATPSESPKKIEVDGVQLASESPKLGGKCTVAITLS